MVGNNCFGCAMVVELCDLCLFGYMFFVTAVLINVSHGVAIVLED